ncbi:hypothetical protein NL676_034442 [Syzygium grande]|nr:hypothetical protein NL676_034442 [Syzygium grande]
MSREEGGVGGGLGVEASCKMQSGDRGRSDRLRIVAIEGSSGGAIVTKGCFRPFLASVLGGGFDGFLSLLFSFLLFFSLPSSSDRCPCGGNGTNLMEWV